MVLLSLFGLIMVYSSSMVTTVKFYNLPSAEFFFQKQGQALILSFAAMIFTMIFPYKAYQNKLFLMIIMTSITLLMAFVTFFGHNAGNASSWIKVGNRLMQPAEFAKLALIIYLSAIYAKRQNRINNLDKAVMPPVYFMIIICFLLILQPDYGSAAILFIICSSIILSSGMSMKTLTKLLGFSGAVALIPLTIMLLSGKLSFLFSEGRVSRFIGYSDPFGTAQKEGYQLVNSLFAIKSGGLTGLGLGQSVQKFGYLPEAHTDFIIAVITEELGVIGAILVLAGLGFIVLRGYVMSSRCQDPFGSLLLIGISTMIGVQVFINVGGATGLIPITGITLPFISYGGSSLLLMMASMGIYQNIIMRMNLKKQKEPAVTEETLNM